MRIEFAVTLCGLLIASPAFAQSSAVRETIPVVEGHGLWPAQPAAARPSDPLLDPAVLAEAPLASKCEDWRISFDVGLPTGLRLQRRIVDSNWWIEGGIGTWWVVPYASLCLRYDWAVVQRQRNWVSIRPSLSATVVPIDTTVGGGFDTEFVWTHCWGDRFRTEMGLRAGVSIMSHRGRRDADFKTAPVPVLCFVFAMAF